MTQAASNDLPVFRRKSGHIIANLLKSDGGLTPSVKVVWVGCLLLLLHRAWASMGSRWRVRSKITA